MKATVSIAWAACRHLNETLRVVPVCGVRDRNGVWNHVLPDPWFRRVSHGSCSCEQLYPGSSGRAAWLGSSASWSRFFPNLIASWRRHGHLKEGQVGTGTSTEVPYRWRPVRRSCCKQASRGGVQGLHGSGCSGAAVVAVAQAVCRATRRHVHLRARSSCVPVQSYMCGMHGPGALKCGSGLSHGHAKADEPHSPAAPGQGDQSSALRMHL